MIGFVYIMKLVNFINFLLILHVYADSKKMHDSSS